MKTVFNNVLGGLVAAYIIGSFSMMLDMKDKQASYQAEMRERVARIEQMLSPAPHVQFSKQ